MDNRKMNRSGQIALQPTCKYFMFFYSENLILDFVKFPILFVNFTVKPRWNNSKLHEDILKVITYDG